jgi:hypothetical protein
MRYANLAGRAALLTDGGAIDIERASGGRLPADPQAVLAHWRAVREWATGAPAGAATPFNEIDLGAPAPRPAQVFGIGLNYRDHAAESGMPLPDRPATFTKFPTCLAGRSPCRCRRRWSTGGRAGGGDRRARPSRRGIDGWRHVASLTSARISPSASCSGRAAGSSPSASRFQGSGRWARGW